ncbi:MAG: hypothetical protein OXN25_23505 [Candidatus Poribacteria bacterium]|nr:hypothetical protein [Candidatus Poribacteria bacterium]
MEEPIPGPKIEGPWLWTIVPMGQDTTDADLGKDHLAAFTNGAVTENQIAKNGATAYTALGDTGAQWFPHSISATDPDNISGMLRVLEGLILQSGNINIDAYNALFTGGRNKVAYGSIILNSPRRQNTLMFAGSDDNHRVWLNGQLVHDQLDWNYAHDYQEAFPVTLKRGRNVLLVAVQDDGGGRRWGGFFGFEDGTAYSVVEEGFAEEAIIEEELVEEGIAATGAGPKIEGPWLWMIVSTGQKGGKAAAISGRDYLAAASGGAVKEQQIAKNGVKAGALVGNRAWTPGELGSTGGNNIGETVNAIGLGSGDIDNHVAYGSIAFNSPRKQNTTMYVGSDDAVKVWLNGKLVHDNPLDRGADDYQEDFPVTLKKGKNTLFL